MTEEVFILDCHSDIFVWVGQQVDVKVRLQALDIGEVIIYFSVQKHFRSRIFFRLTNILITAPEIPCA